MKYGYITIVHEWPLSWQASPLKMVRRTWSHPFSFLGYSHFALHSLSHFRFTPPPPPPHFLLLFLQSSCLFFFLCPHPASSLPPFLSFPLPPFHTSLPSCSFLFPLLLFILLLFLSSSPFSHFLLLQPFLPYSSSASLPPFPPFSLPFLLLSLHFQFYFLFCLLPVFVSPMSSCSISSCFYW